MFGLVNIALFIWILITFFHATHMLDNIEKTLDSIHKDIIILSVNNNEMKSKKHNGN